MNRAYYSDTIHNFLSTSSNEVLGKLTLSNDFPLEQTQRDTWLEEIEILSKAFSPYQGSVYFEYLIPRMVKRIDAVVLIGPVIFVLEFKSGEKDFLSHAIDQVWDYALDLKNFHETSHSHLIAPILIATKAEDISPVIALTPHNDKLLIPIKCNNNLLGEVIENVFSFLKVLILTLQIGKMGVIIQHLPS